MPHYRVYFLKQNGKLMGVGNFRCRDDETARARINQLISDGHEVELWRLISQVHSGIKRSSAIVDLNQVTPAKRTLLHS